MNEQLDDAYIQREDLKIVQDEVNEKLKEVEYKFKEQLAK